MPQYYHAAVTISAYTGPMAEARANTYALLVDDDSKTTPVHLHRLTQDGYRVTTVADSAGALTLARETQPNVIFVHLGAKGSGNSAFIVSLRAADDTRHGRVARAVLTFD